MSEPTWSDGLLEAGFGDPELAAMVGWPARVARMVEVEAALAGALADVGLLDPGTADAIVAACDPTRLDLAALAEATASAPTPVIALVRALQEGADDEAAAWLHHGATSQDVIDTAVALQLRGALEHLDTSLSALADRCAELAERHRGTVMAGRTLGQQAVPITFGLKAARWLGALDRRIEQLRWVAPRSLTVQLGGAAGTSGVYGDAGIEVAEALAGRLGLAVPDLPWHAERDRIADLAGTLGGIVAAVGSIAADLVLLAQPEVGEAREQPGTAPSSSAMPHKRNPVHATAARAACRLALGELSVLHTAVGEHEHERAAGAWQAEWVALPSALVRAGGAVARLHAALADLEVDGERALANLEAQHGLVGSEALATAMTPALGRPRAQALAGELAAAAAAEERPLHEVVSSSAEATAAIGQRTPEEVLDPGRVLGLVPLLIDRALATHHRIRTSSELR
ncbi:lyase family protein [Nitriliruptor alkaliphilus]|uniref:lyase family protein n=1 Tax=Nitriliruptor alkaliphilus TaxID=427918 RepID=UPI0006965225|nr:lyase family protein [Nitriliruptor alkaliphilus]